VISASQKMFLIFALLSFPVFLINLEYTGIVVVIPAISIALKLSLAQASWVIIIYLLVFSALIITGGRLGDLYLAKHVIIAGLILFILGSLIGGISVNAWQIIIGRGIQALGAALTFPNIMSIVYNYAPERKKGLSIGLLSTFVGAAMAIGPLLAGLLTTYTSWRYFFLMNVPIGLIVICLIAYYLPAVETSMSKKKSKLDIRGIVLLSIFLTSLIYTLNLLKNGLEDPGLLSSTISITLLSLILFIYNEKKVSMPLINLMHFANLILLVSCLIRAGISFGFYIVLFILGLYLHFVMGFSAFSSGFILFPMSVAIGLFSLVGGKAVDCYGVYIPTVFGISLLSVCYFGFMVLPIQHDVILLISLLIIYGIAYAFISPGLVNIMMRSVPKPERGLASGMFYMMSVFGSAVGMTITGIILHIFRRFPEKINLVTAFPLLMRINFIIAIFSLLILLTLSKIIRYNIIYQ